MVFQGAFTALVTPFTADGSSVDYEKLRELVEWQIEQGIDGLVPVRWIAQWFVAECTVAHALFSVWQMGTTGESPTVSHDEHDKVIAEVIKYANKRVPVIAGTGSNSTVEAVRLTQAAKDAGADACLVVCPYYNKPTQKGMYEHFNTVAAVGLPVILYNIPGRTGIALTTETIVALSKIPGIVAIKDATGSVDQVSDLVCVWAT